MFKCETHMHVGEVSRCAKISAREMIEIYKARGYTTVFCTDHLAANNFPGMDESSWEEKVNYFCRGYENARAAGEELGVTVLFGAEINFAGCPNHYLLYGITRELLLNTPHIFEMSLEELYAYSRENGFTIVQAHPFRDGRNYPTPRVIDAFEVCNTNPRHNDHDELARAVASVYGKPTTAGSDAHRTDDAALGGVLTEEKITTVEDYIRLLLNGELIFIGEENDISDK
ncbi:MAG: PHP domain-containing protein [Clostridia bacterium]|nr:PHP domain-containing protein [Clostridia bacterium]